MKIRLAKTAGFCMGVRRAVDLALDLQRVCPPLPIVTYGPLIHNPQTLELLESRGIRKVDCLDEIEEGTVVIRAHGISPQERRALEEKQVRIIDATCPRVARVQAVVRKHAAKNHFCVIVGDEDHPEVRGVLGFASAGGVAVSSPDDEEAIQAIDPERETCVVAQTTQKVQTFLDVVQVLGKRCPTLHVYNTICDSTRKRQAEVSRLGRQADLVVVVGGKGSGNTQRLAQLARSHGVDTLHVETVDEIPPAALVGANTVGVTAGASTPNWQIQSIIHRLKEIGLTRATGPLGRLRRLADIAVMTYLWAALGGGGLTATCLTLQSRPVTWLPLIVAMLFVFSMHLLNRILDKSGAARFNTPEIAAFYARHHELLAALGVSSSAGALILSWWLGMHSFLLLTAMVGAGLLYTVPSAVHSWPPLRRWRSLKQIPGSKTPLVALGWASAAALLPVVGSLSLAAIPALAVAFVFAAGMVFWRTALSDLLDVQGDRIVGRETIPILIGLDKSSKLLKGLLISLAILLVCSAALGWIPPIGYWLVLNIAVFGILFVVHQGHQVVDRLPFDGMVDGNLLLAGAVSIVYGMA